MYAATARMPHLNTLKQRTFDFAVATFFWLEYLVATTLLTGPQVKKLQSESNELVAVLTASQKTARANYIHEKKRRHALRQKRTADQQP